LEQVLKRAPDNLAAIRGLAELHDRTEHDDVASMQTGPSRWATPDGETEPLDDELPEYASPEVASEAETFDAEPGPWIGLQPESDPPDVPIHQFANVREAAESHPAAFVNEISEVDALAAELLEIGAHAVEPAPAFATAAEEDHRWNNDALQLDALDAPVHLHEAPPLLEFVPPGPVAADDGFIPDEGPGPWPPVFADDDAPASDHQVLRLAHGSADRDSWPPFEVRPPVRCVPAPTPAAPTVASQSASALATPERAGLLSALGRFRRRVDARRRAVVSEYVAG
jgi:hypothetical protein